MIPILEALKRRYEGREYDTLTIKHVVSRRLTTHDEPSLIIIYRLKLDPRKKYTEMVAFAVAMGNDLLDIEIEITKYYRVRVYFKNDTHTERLLREMKKFNAEDRTSEEEVSES